MFNVQTKDPWKRHVLWPQWNITPLEKTLWPQWDISSWFIALLKKTWFYERLFFEEMIFMVKDEKNTA